MKKVLLIILALSIVISCAAGFAACSSKDDENVITIRNLYFNDWDGSDDYTKMLQEKFGISFKVSSYSWSDWSEQVSGSVNARKLPNVFQDDVDSYNFANTYRFYAEDGDVKALPDDLSKWPNVKALIDGISDIEHFKIDGKLYGIPVAKNIKGGSEDFAPFTYVYRRDWALELQSKLSFPVPADDVYTWRQFNELLDVFYREKCGSGNVYALADVEWGFPSVINFYKDAPHCFVYGSDGKVTSNYATTEYLKGLSVAKDLVDRQIYGYPQYESNEGDANKAYYGGRIGVFYENLSLTNYTTLRKQIKNINPKLTTEQINNMTAIMKVQGEDGKYTLEGQEDWFSMTFFSSKISDAKMEKILDIMDYLLSEEGTLFGLYGEEGYDYEKVRLDSGKSYDYKWDETYGIKLLSWTKEAGTGNYVNPFNGARYLRYTCTLGYDIIDKDPLTDATAYPILKAWTDFMQAQEAAGRLRVLREPAEVKWLATEKKSLYAGGMLEDANASVETYLYSEKPDLEKYKKEVTTGTWKTIIDEINAALGK
ncbi:MAG: extracellular solute-binding protein [Clostridia bacterium]|nr:extracellular solute-binding protein [Clostridia bacterium]